MPFGDNMQLRISTLNYLNISIFAKIVRLVALPTFIISLSKHFEIEMKVFLGKTLFVLPDFYRFYPKKTKLLNF